MLAGVGTHDLCTIRKHLSGAQMMMATSRDDRRGMLREGFHGPRGGCNHAWRCNMDVAWCIGVTGVARRPRRLLASLDEHLVARVAGTSFCRPSLVGASCQPAASHRHRLGSESNCACLNSSVNRDDDQPTDYRWCWCFVVGRQMPLPGWPMAGESIIGNGHMAISELIDGIRSGLRRELVMQNVHSNHHHAALCRGVKEMETGTLGWGAAAGQIDNSNSREPGPLRCHCSLRSANGSRYVGPDHANWYFIDTLMALSGPCTESSGRPAIATTTSTR